MFEVVIEGAGAPHQYTAFVLQQNSDSDAAHRNNLDRLAEHTFEWRSDSTALGMGLVRLQEIVLSGYRPKNDEHVKFGKQLFQTVFAGSVGELWRKQVASSRSTRTPLRLVLCLDHATAHLLVNLPWEYLHDGEDFLVLNWRTPFSRLPWGLPTLHLEPLDEPLRVLVVISAPRELGHMHVLDTARDEDLVLSALADARRAGRVQTDFAPNASLDGIRTALRQFKPHILHFVGHGDFSHARNMGFLLLEDADGYERWVPNNEFADMLEQHGRSLRMVFLAACHSAVNSRRAPGNQESAGDDRLASSSAKDYARDDAYRDLVPRLLDAGVAAIVAMQFSVLDQSAMQFSSAVYTEIVAEKSIDEAVTQARIRLKDSSSNNVDFATPVLFLADPYCLTMDETALAAQDEGSRSNRTRHPLTPVDLMGLVEAQRFVGRSAELRDLQTGLDPEHGRWRAAVIYGLGGMGKTALAARLAHRMSARLDGVVAMRVTPTSTSQSVFDRITSFLAVSNARFNNRHVSELTSTLVKIKDEKLPLETKASVLVEILRTLRLLVILDNYEDLLPEGHALSRAIVTHSGKPTSQSQTRSVSDSGSGSGGGSDTNISDSSDNSSNNIIGLATPSEFDTPGREEGNTDTTDGAPEQGVLAPIADPELHKLIALLVGSTPGPSRFLFTSRVDFTPLEPGRIPEAIHHLPLPQLQFRDAVYLMESLPPLDRLPVALYGDEQPGHSPITMPTASGNLSLRVIYNRLGGHPYSIGLFARLALDSLPEKVFSHLAGVRKDLIEFALLDGAVAELTQPARRLLRRVAIYDEPVPMQGLSYMFSAEDGVVATISEPQDEVLSLLKRGLVSWHPGRRDEEGTYVIPAVVRDWALKDATVEELRELWAQAASYWLAVAADSQDLGDDLRARHYLFLAGQYESADTIVNAATPFLVRWGHIELLLSLLEESIRTTSGQRQSAAMGNKAIVYQGLGQYTQAKSMYLMVLTALQELGDRREVAITLHQVGILHQEQGEYEQAREMYTKSLAIAQELGDRSRVASTLHQLGMLYEQQGEYEQAREMYTQSLSIKQELGDRSGVAITLHQLGNLHYLLGKYEQAREMYTKSLAIAQELGDRSGVAITLHQVGILHQQQGEYEQAREMYTKSLSIKQELGDRSGVAITLGQLGLLNERQGRMQEAVGALAQALILFEQLGAPQREQARYELARLREQMGEQAFDEAVQAVLEAVQAVLEAEPTQGDDT